MNNNDVVQSWRRGKPAKGSNLKTDGSELYSYGLLIGRTKGKTDRKHVIDYTGDDAYSKTTSRHVNQAKRVAHRIINPSKLQ